MTTAWTENRKARKFRGDKKKKKQTLNLTLRKKNELTAAESAKLQEVVLERYLDFKTNKALCEELGIPENTLYGWICDPTKATPEFKEKCAALKVIRRAMRLESYEDFMDGVASGVTPTGKDSPINMPNITAGIFMCKSLDKETYGEKQNIETKRSEVTVIEINKINGTVKKTEEHILETTARHVPELPEGVIDDNSD